MLLPAKVDLRKERSGPRTSSARGRKARLEEDIRPVPATRRKGRYNIKRSIYQKALAYYCSLGSGRTLAQVTQHFKRKHSIVNDWSLAFKGTEKIQILENRPKESVFREEAMSLLLLLLQSLSAWNEKEQMVLTAGEKWVFERPKLAVDPFAKLRSDEWNETEKTRGRMATLRKKTNGMSLVTV